MINLTQTAAARAASALLTLVSHASDRDVERFLGLLERLAPGLDEYAQTLAPLLDRAWQEDFVVRGFRPPPGPGQPRPVETGG